MNFEEFCATRRAVADLGDELKIVELGGCPGLLYTSPSSVWFVERVYDAGVNTGKFHTIVSREEHTTESLDDMERWLWERVPECEKELTALLLDLTANAAKLLGAAVQYKRHNERGAIACYGAITAFMHASTDFLRDGVPQRTESWHVRIMPRRGSREDIVVAQLIEKVEVLRA